MTKQTPVVSTEGPLLKLPKVPVGLYGEIVVAHALAALGFRVDMRGGGAKFSDGIADRDDLCLDVQVKCTSKLNGAIHWAKAGDDARTYADLAEKRNRLATFILAHATAVQNITTVGDEMRLPIPTMSLHAVDARTFADDVDAERTYYGQQLYLRGDNKGQSKPESGLSFPVNAGDYPTLAEFIANQS